MQKNSNVIKKMYSSKKNVLVIVVYGHYDLWHFLKSKLNLPDKYEKTEKVWTLFIDPRKTILFIWTYQLFEISLPGASWASIKTFCAFYTVQKY